jgi:hypothetical protein
MKRALIAIVATFALWFVGRAVVHAFASDATLIRWTIDDMIEGFNDTRMNPILDGLDREFLDATYGADRELVRGALAYLFLNSKDPATKAFPYRAEWADTAPPSVDTKSEPRRAHVEFEVRFFLTERGAEKPVWRIAVHGELQKRDGAWRFKSTETVTKDGTRLR